MALLVDPDDITYEISTTPSTSAMLTISTSGRDIYLTEVGALDTAGVTLQCIYSKLKEIWKDESSVIAYPFPMEAITPEQFEFINDWAPANAATRKLFRTAGWAERVSGVIVRQYTGIISLGSLGATDQPYFNQSGTATNFTYEGPVNEAVQVYAGPSDGNYDYRTSLTLYAREQGKTYASSALTDIGVTSLTYQAYRFPLTNATDLKITATDNTIDTTTPYTGMSITYYATPQSRTIGASSYNFGIIIDGNNGTAEEIYEFVQRQLRKDSDIDADASTLIGKLAADLLVFVGDTLKTKYATNPDGGGNGVYIDNFDSNDTNRLVFTDNTNAERTFPFVAAGTITFNTNLQTDMSAKYWMFFTDTYATSGAIIVNDNDDVAITGNISGQSSISFTFDYDGNNQGGRTPATDADVTVVAIGLETAQYVSSTATITRATGQNISLVASLERNYLDPA